MTSAGQTIRYDGRTGFASKIIATIFGLIFLVAGSWFLKVTARGVYAGAQTWSWQKTVCTIVSSGVGQEDQNTTHPGDFRVAVKYRYAFGGKELLSDTYERQPAMFQDYGKAARLAGRYREWARGICYVNPAEPTEAVLVRYNLFSVLTLLFPMMFVAIGGGTIYFSWRRKPLQKGDASPISDRSAAPRHRWIIGAFFSVFLLVGACVSYGLFFRPLWKIYCARNWPALPCVVISSEVRTSEDGDDGPTYSINIFYSYEFNGSAFKGNAYGFLGGSSSGYKSKQAVVSRHPPGSMTVCYANPSDPTEAVLVRGFTPDMWFGLIPLVFFFVGAGGIYFTFRTYRRGMLAGTSLSAPAERQSKDCLLRGRLVPSRAQGWTPNSESVVLKPKTSPWMKLFGTVFACLFWNGIVSVFVVQAVKSWRAGAPEWGLTIFLIPFVAIGVGLVGAVPYFFMGLFNPRPCIKVTPGSVPLGQTLEVQWAFAGRSGVLQKLLLHLEGREEATFSQGSNSVTDKNVFFSQVLVNSQTPSEMNSGGTRVTIPARLAPSFAGKHNKIVWEIHLHGEIDWWPDLREEFAVAVMPPVRRNL